jgi:nucleotide-binding universal stress UspA family protein
MKTKIQKPNGARRRPVTPPLRQKISRRRKITAPVIDLVPSLLQIKSILVPIDFSAQSKKALAYAVPFAEQFGAKLTLLHVVEPVATADFANTFPLVMENDKVMSACKGRLEHVIKEIDPSLVEKALVRYGRSFHEIAEAARTLKVNLIILSTHGYTGLKRAVLGSTTERVVRYAPCPVLVVREHEHEFTR